MPLGPRVVLTRSAMAIAPMKEDMRAFSPLNGREGGGGRKGGRGGREGGLDVGDKIEIRDMD